MARPPLSLSIERPSHPKVPLDTAGSDCEGKNGEQFSGWFVSDATATLPLTIVAGGGKATFEEPIVRLVE